MNDANKTPEQLARDEIDRQLKRAGWVIQPFKGIDLSAAMGVAVREYQTDVGPADYVLFVDGGPVGVVEAKPESWGHRITTVEEQSRGYASAKLRYVNNTEPLPFIYESTGIITRFSNVLDTKPRSRKVFAFHQPETLLEWYQTAPTLRTALRSLPELPTKGLRDCQINAITKLEESLGLDKPRALIQMATGAGKRVARPHKSHGCPARGARPGMVNGYCTSKRRVGAPD